MIEFPNLERTAGGFAALTLLLLAPLAHAAPQGGEAQIWVKFVDESGKAIAGVELKHQVQGRRQTIATSAADGLAVATIAWPWPTEARAWTGVAEHFGHALQPVQAKLARGRETDLGEMKLAPGGAVSGRVVGADGRAMVDAEVRVVPSDAEEEPLARHQTFSFSKDDGSYRVVGITPGSYRVWAKHETSRWGKVDNIFVEAAKDITGVDLKVEYLPDEYRIDGKVLDPGGKPVANAELRTSVPDTDGAGQLVSRAVSNAQGNFSLFLSVQPEEPFWIEVHDPAERWSDLSFGDAVPGDRDVVLQFKPAVDVELAVLDASGAPIEEFGYAVKVERGARNKVEETPSGPRPGGVARIRAPSAPFRIEVRSRLHEPKSIGPIDPSTLQGKTEVRLDRLPTITGRVTHAGKPLSGATVVLVRAAANPFTAVDPEFVTSRYAPVGDFSARTDAQGRFAIGTKQRTPECRLLVSSDVASEGVSGVVQVGGPEVAIELGSGGTVEGAVTLPAGVEPKYALVEIYRESNTKRVRLPIDASRKWRSEHLSPGPWLANVVFLPPPAAERTASTPVGASKEPPFVFEVTEGRTTKRDLDFSRGAECPVSGALTVAGKPPGRAVATLYSKTTPALELSSCTVTEDGRITLAAREPGEYRIAWRGEGSKFSKNVVVERVQLVAGQNTWARDLTEEQWRVQGIDLSKK